MVNQWSEFLSEKCGDWGLPAAGDWTFWLYNNYQPRSTNVNVMWFRGGEDFPRVFTKFDRDPAALRREFENMSRVYTSAPGCVPKPLSFGRLGPFWGLWIEAVQGFPIQVSASDGTDRMRAVVETLISIHSAVRDQGEVSPLRHRNMVRQPLEFVAEFGESTSVRTGCAELARAASPEWLSSVPVIPQHGDLFAGNVLLSNHRPCVIDWESFGAIDLPFHDLLTFFIGLLTAEGAAPETWTADLVKQIPDSLEFYGRSLGLTSADLDRLLSLTLVNWFSVKAHDGCEKFAPRMYRLIDHHFRHRDFWRTAFLGRFR